MRYTSEPIVREHRSCSVYRTVPFHNWFSESNLISDSFSRDAVKSPISQAVTIIAPTVDARGTHICMAFKQSTAVLGDIFVSKKLRAFSL